ncbi:MAG: phospholipid/glycerol acyltransferase [Ferruginibacter sp.]|nr:phospholipid/glycerol acyltransferase [Ferruginibacter sp.]
MLYGLVKLVAKVAFRFYCRDLQLNKPGLLQCEGPLMLAVNHPNSFLDAIILCTLFDKPVYSLARGDAFNGRWISRILQSFKMLPVYRVSEGVENLEENYKTFELCKEIFKQNGIVLIFSEGKCINEWHLRPLKKGTARLALSSWADGIPLKVLPIAMNYSSFEKFGKNIRMFFGEFITSQEVGLEDGHGKSIQAFNSILEQQLAPFVFEIDKTDQQKLKELLYVSQPFLKKIVLFLPSIAGWLMHAPLYYPVKKFVIKKTNSTDHFDSVVVALLLVAYPLYVGVISLLVFSWTSQWYAFLLLLIFPATAWSHLQLKKQLA